MTNETIVMLIALVLAALAVMVCATWSDVGRLYKRIEELERLVVILSRREDAGNYSYIDDGKINTVYPDARMEVEQEPGEKLSAVAQAMIDFRSSIEDAFGPGVNHDR